MKYVICNKNTDTNKRSKRNRTATTASYENKSLSHLQLSATLT